MKPATHLQNHKAPATTAKPMRIVHIIIAQSGAPWLSGLAREQKKLGHDVIAIVPSLDCNLAQRLAANGITLHAADLNFFSMRPLVFFPRLVRLARLLRRLRPDVVHSHLLPSVVSGRLAAWVADVPLRMSMNAGPLTLQSPLMRVADAGTTWADTHTIASCELTRTLYIEAGTPAGQVELIYYAVDQSSFDPALADGRPVRREWGVPDDAPLIGYVAYFYPKLDDWATAPPGMLGRTPKAHDVLLRALPDVLARCPAARVVFVGAEWIPCGVEQELRDLARELGVDHAVIFAGERSDVPDAIAAMDISIHCSLTENVGGAVESLLMAKPMVVSRVGGMVDAVRDGETGLVVPPDDPPALAKALLRLIDDPALRAQLGARGREWMLERFMLWRTVADFEALYARATSQARPAYRRATALHRAVQLPWRLVPILWGVEVLRHKAFLRTAGPWHRRARYRLRWIAGRLYRMVVPRKTA